MPSNTASAKIYYLDKKFCKAVSGRGYRFQDIQYSEAALVLFEAVETLREKLEKGRLKPQTAFNRIVAAEKDNGLPSHATADGDYNIDMSGHAEQIVSEIKALDFRPSFKDCHDPGEYRMARYEHFDQIKEAITSAREKLTISL